MQRYLTRQPLPALNFIDSLAVVRIELSLVQHVYQSAWRGDHNVNASIQHVPLFSHVDSAYTQQCPDLWVIPALLQRRAHELTPFVRLPG